jgi:hypothetical protein
MGKALVAIALTVILAFGAFAGDEVDYSAPYLTLENGELVTKYPAREHVPGGEPVPVLTESGREPTSPPDPPRWPVIAVITIVMIAGLVLLRRREERQAREAKGQAE